MRAVSMPGICLGNCPKHIPERHSSCSCLRGGAAWVTVGDTGPGAGCLWGRLWCWSSPSDRGRWSWPRCPGCCIVFLLSVTLALCPLAVVSLTSLLHGPLPRRGCGEDGPGPRTGPKQPLVHLNFLSYP